MSGVGANHSTDILFETSLHTEFGRWRSPGACGDHCYPDLVFDILPYIDMLLKDCVTVRAANRDFGHIDLSLMI